MNIRKDLTGRIRGERPRCPQKHPHEDGSVASDSEIGSPAERMCLWAAVVKMITIVSGLPRSGSSMMMKMLEAGGISIVADGVRAPDADNPQGYYEDERVKTLKETSAWLDEVEGKAVKIISHLLYNLPKTRQYKILFMKRTLEEVVASQNAMLDRRKQERSPVSDHTLIEFFEHHLLDVQNWLHHQKYMEVLYLNYRDVVDNAVTNARNVQMFLKDVYLLDVERMVGVIDKRLYRQRV